MLNSFKTLKMKIVTGLQVSLFTILISCTTPIHAQDIVERVTKDKLGLLIGTTLDDRMDIERVSGNLYPTSASTKGLLVGIRYYRHIKDSLYIGMEVRSKVYRSSITINLASVATQGEGPTVKMNTHQGSYISIPVLVRKEFKKMCISAGPVFQKAISRNTGDYYAGDIDTTRYTLVETDYPEVNSKVRSGIMLACGYRLPWKSYQVELGAEAVYHFKPLQTGLYEIMSEHSSRSVGMLKYPGHYVGFTISLNFPGKKEVTKEEVAQR